MTSKEKDNHLERKRKETTVSFQKVKAPIAAAFGSDSEDNEDVEEVQGPSRYVFGELLSVENAIAKAARLKNEGIVHAERGRFREAIGLFTQALECAPDDHISFELKAQALLECGENFQAVQAATRATELAPKWFPGWLTLGRSQLNFGELDLAKATLTQIFKDFAIDAGIDDDDLRAAEEDLQFVTNLCNERDRAAAQESSALEVQRRAVGIDKEAAKRLPPP
eukprot:m.183886 g.183886  ORF g.183886 m.183886 type:complete len:224 (-) comp15550_c0_seq12:2086-2757(-)